MKTLGKVLVGLLILLVVLAAALPMFLSSETIISKVSEQVKNNTGRELTVNGEADFSVFPALVLTMQDVRFSNMAGGSQANMATMGALDIHIPWLSIFTGDLVVDKFVIDKPEILLETNKQGRANWQMLSGGAAAAAASSNASTPTKEDTAGGPTKLPESFDINLGDIEIKNGRLTIIDHGTGDTKTLENLGLAIELPSLRKDLTVKGTVTYMAQTFDLTTAITTPAKAINGLPFNVELNLDSQLVKLNYKGEVSDGGNKVAGNVAVAADSVKEILAWQKIPLKAKDNAFNRFSIDADISKIARVVTFDKLDAKFDALEFKGSSTITLVPVPMIKLDIDLGMLDLNPYLPEPVEVVPPPESTVEAQPIVWDDTAIDLAGLKAVNADIKVRSTGLKARDIKLGSNRFNLMLMGGKLKLTMEEFNAYEGQGNGHIQVNAAAKPYKIATKFNFDGIDANPLLNDVAKFDKLLGKGGMKWDLQTQGQSQKDFVHQLNGFFGLNFKDGAVKGLNLAAIARSAQNLLTGSFSDVSLDQDFNHAEKTDFAELTASFVFTNGVGANQDLALLNPFVEVTGSGTVDLPNTNIDFKIKNKITGSMEGQASDTGKSGLTIPIKIKGPFHKIKVRPDIGGAAQDKAKDNLKDKALDKLKGLFN